MNTIALYDKVCLKASRHTTYSYSTSFSLGIRSLASARALAGVHLLEFDDVRRPWLLWKTWLSALGLENARPKGILRFNQYDQVIHAAVAGQGIALATSALIGDYLDAGRLVRPFSQQLPGAYQYYVVCPEAAAERPAIAAFRSWIHEEAAAHATLR